MTDDLDKLWLACARTRWWDVTDAMCKFRFELQAPDLARFQRMLYGWTYGNSQDFRQNTLASLNCDPDAWRRGDES